MDRLVICVGNQMWDLNALSLTVFVDVRFLHLVNATVQTNAGVFHVCCDNTCGGHFRPIRKVLRVAV